MAENSEQLNLLLKVKKKYEEKKIQINNKQ